MRIRQSRRPIHALASLSATATVALGGALVPSAARADDVVTIPDANLKAAINTVLGHAADADVSTADALTVTALTSFPGPIADLTGLAAFTNLTRFQDTLSGNTFTDLTPLSGLSKLVSLNLDNSGLTSADLAPIEGLTQLTYLELKGNQITDTAPLSGFTNLTTGLTLDNNPLTSLSGLPSAQKVATVSLINDNIKDPSALVGKFAPSVLTTLKLSNNRIADASSLAPLGLSGAKIGSQSTASTGLLLAGNRIADFSAFSGWLKPPTGAKAASQSIYTGPYHAGMTVVLKDAGATTAPSMAAADGTYDASTGALTLSDATLATVSADPASNSVGVSPNWNVFFTNPPSAPGDDNGPQIGVTTGAEPTPLDGAAPQLTQKLSVADNGATLDATACTSFSYVWLRDGEQITGTPHGATDATSSQQMGGPGTQQVYAVQPTDVGHRLSVKVTCDDTGVSSTSAPTELVTGDDPASHPQRPVVQDADSVTGVVRVTGQPASYTLTGRSGVVGDPTNPTIPIYVGQPDASGNLVNPSQIQVALASIKGVGNVDTTAVTPDDVQITGTGAWRTIAITPRKRTNGVLAFTFTATGTTGEVTTFTLGYLASRATTVTSRVLPGFGDASTGIDVGDGHMLVADDELSTINLYDATRSAREVARFPLPQGSGPGAGRAGELDLEASARNGNMAYWFGSLGNDKAGEYQASRNQIYATKITGTGANTTLTPVGTPYQTIRQDLIAWDQANNNRFGFAKANTSIPPNAIDGFDLEGAEFSRDNSELYLAFRDPVYPATATGKAIIVPVTNFADLFAGDGTHATFGDPILLDLHGESIREIRKNASGEYLIIGAPAGQHATATEHLWAWNGDPAAAPQELTTSLPEDVEAYDTSENNGAWEGIFGMPERLAPGAQLGLMMDQGYDQLYAPGQDNKDNTSPYTATSRTDMVTLTGRVGTVAALSTPTAFAPQAASTIGAAQTVTVTNQGSNVLHVGQIATTDTDGVSADDFLVSSNACTGAALDLGESCTVRVRFAPSRVDATSTATLVVQSDVVGGRTTATLTGTSTALPKGDTGATGATGAQGPKGDKGDKGDPGARGPRGTIGLTGPRGPAGTIGFSAAKKRVSVHAGGTARLRFLVQNRTAGTVAAKLKAKAPKALRVSGARSVKVRQLLTGMNKQVAFRLRVATSVKAGTYKVRVNFLVGGSRVTRTVAVRVVR
jgi:Leucine-rich repeat (LRR) protein